LILKETKIIALCDKITLFSIFIIAFFLPISKAIIESFAILAIASFILKKIIAREGIPKTHINWAIFIYFAICFLSIFIGSNFRISSRVLFGKILQELLFFFAVVETLNTKNRVKNFLCILFVSSLLLGIDGIYQHFTHKEFIRHRRYQDIPRIHATFPSANDYGCYLSTVITFVIAAFFDKLNFKKLFRVSLIGLFILLFACIFLTLSQGAWLALIASLLFMSIRIRLLGVLFLSLSIALIISRQFYIPFLKRHLANFYPILGKFSIDIDRLQIWQAAWKMILHKAWFGLGLGTFMFNFRKFAAETYPNSPPYAHNCYLQMAAEIGVIGLASFLSILALFFYRGINYLNKNNRAFHWYMLLASLASILGYCAQMAVDTNFYSLDLGMLFWMVFGLGVAAMKRLELEA
jgi:putative inorganic carbon (hco3(-)) transporter